jgi:hypothetical protein
VIIQKAPRTELTEGDRTPFGTLLSPLGSYVLSTFHFISKTTGKTTLPQLGIGRGLINRATTGIQPYKRTLPCWDSSRATNGVSNHA